MKDKLFSVLALCGATRTLFCCVLPAVVSTVAGGAAVGAMLSLFPWLFVLSYYKIWVFIGAGLLILINGMLVFRSQRKLSCAMNEEKGCAITGTFSRNMFWIALCIYSIGFLFSYMLVPFLRLWG